MAKFKNPLEQMAAMPEPEKPKPPKKMKVGDFENPLNQVSDQEKAKAVGSSLIAGQYIRKTFTLTPGQIRRIREIARELHIPETSVARWLIDMGLHAWERGERPEMIQESVKLEPKLTDW